MIYIYIYMGLSLLSIIDNFKHNFKIHYIFIALALFVLISIRFDVGTDYFAYYDFFGRERESIFDINFEPGFSIIVYFLRLWGFGPEFIMAMFAFVSIILTYIGVSRHSKAIGISLLIYFSLYLIPMNFNAVSQGVAIGFYLFSLKYIIQRDITKTSIISLIAFALHSSGVFIFLSYLFLSLNFNRNRLALLVILSCFLIVLNSQISSLIVNLPISSISEKMSSYNEIFEGNVSYASYAIRLFVVLALLCLYDRMSHDDRDIMRLYVLSIFFYSVFFNNGLLATRINLFFKVLDVILIANVVYYFKSGISRYIVWLCITIFCFLILSANFNNEKVWNYQVIQNVLN
ncbi:putative EpsG-like glucosyltransferase [Vibrio chagasii]|nr:putative EpsG-like glucosyltransferase [Vibrio chagasii]